MSIRKTHNTIKRNLIESSAQQGQHMLDVGCGCGGDINKWFHVGVNLTMCDPDLKSLVELKERLKGRAADVYHGDILNIPEKTFDVICYNFSLQYIFETKELFVKSIQSIRSHLKPQGKLIGCIPDSDFIIMNPNFKDTLGNFIIRNTNKTGWGNFGEKLFVNLVETPYYKNGPKPEPIAYKDVLITSLQDVGINLVHWKKFKSPHEISKLYSEFIFIST